MFEFLKKTISSLKEQKSEEKDIPAASAEVKVLLKKAWRRYEFERKIFVLSSLVYGAIVLLLLSLVISKKQVVILTPPEIREKLAISTNTASEPYFKEMALYLTQLVGNLSPNTVDFAIKVFSSYLDPSIYEAVSDSLEEVAEMIKRKQTAMAFYPQKIGRVGDTWYVVGELYRFGTAQKTQIRQGGLVTYEIKFKVRSFRLYVTSFKQVSGDSLRKAVTEARKKQLRH